MLIERDLFPFERLGCTQFSEMLIERGLFPFERLGCAQLLGVDPIRERKELTFQTQEKNFGVPKFNPRLVPISGDSLCQEFSRLIERIFPFGKIPSTAEAVFSASRQDPLAFGLLTGDLAAQR